MAHEKVRTFKRVLPKSQHISRIKNTKTSKYLQKCQFVSRNQKTKDISLSHTMNWLENIEITFNRTISILNFMSNVNYQKRFYMYIVPNPLPKMTYRQLPKVIHLIYIYSSYRKTGKTTNTALANLKSWSRLPIPDVHEMLVDRYK